MYDDGSSLTFVRGYESTHGDFQWHTGTQTHNDDFYAGSISSYEVARRDVAGVGSPTVGMSLCRNGATSNADCQQVHALNVCNGSKCNLVEMENHYSAGGDSGGPVYYGNTAYGVHQGWVWDVWPFTKNEVFSRADRIDDVIFVDIATN